MAAPVEKHGGEILKFVGDGMLAIFPLESRRGLQRGAAGGASRRARGDARAERAARSRAARSSSGFGIALHVGDVMYGNIGTATRLDFTVIGPAVNVTSRLETCPARSGSLLLSARFAGMCGVRRLRSLGTHVLRGIARPVEVFAVPEAA